jgi:hypothetical protein
MIKHLIKHNLLDYCIDIFFTQLGKNFIQPNLIKKIGSTFTMHFPSDLISLHGEDIHKLMIEAMMYEIQQDIDSNILNDIQMNHYKDMINEALENPEKYDGSYKDIDITVVKIKL